MLYWSLLVFTFRVTCVLDECTLEYKLYSCVYIRTCSRLVTEHVAEQGRATALLYNWETKTYLSVNRVRF
jgi:hypothetical protein